MTLTNQDYELQCAKTRALVKLRNLRGLSGARYKELQDQIDESCKRALEIACELGMLEGA